jgi:putative transposase
MDESLREQIALFRYGVISELVSRPLAPREKEKLLAAIAAKEWVLPGSERTRIGRTTAREWAELYKNFGFDGFKPNVRSDAGRPRALPQLVQRAVLPAAFIQVDLAYPVADRLSRGLELPGQFLRRATRTDKLYHLLPKFRRVRCSVSAHRGLLSP